MMAATHALIGLLLGLSSLYLFPELVLFAALAAFIGGIFPDLDLVHNHRKSLHFPVGYSVLGLVAGGLMLMYPYSYTVAGFYFLASAAIHSLIDILGGGLETRPWIPSDDRAVYSHTMEKWFSPRRIIRYDGSPEDLALSGLTAVPCYLFYSSPLKELALATLAIGAVYAVLRKKIVEWMPDRFL